MYRLRLIDSTPDRPLYLAANLRRDRRHGWLVSLVVDADNARGAPKVWKTRQGVEAFIEHNPALCSSFTIEADQ